MPGIAVIKPALLRFQLLWQGPRHPTHGRWQHLWYWKPLLALCLLCLSAGHVTWCFLSHFLCVFTPLHGIPLPSGACLSRKVSCRELLPAASVQFSFCHSYPNLGLLPAPGKSSPAQWALFQQAELTRSLPCLYTSLAVIQIWLPGSLSRFWSP